MCGQCVWVKTHHVPTWWCPLAGELYESHLAVTRLKIENRVRSNLGITMLGAAARRENGHCA